MSSSLPTTLSARSSISTVHAFQDFAATSPRRRQTLRRFLTSSPSSDEILRRS